MKKNTALPLAVLLLFLLFASIECQAQQPEATTYTYKVYQAPNKNFGYDIFRNGKIVYREFASMTPPENINGPKNLSVSKLHHTGTASGTNENLALVKSDNAKKAALLAIEKMKRKELPVLSRDEIKMIIAQ